MSVDWILSITEIISQLKFNSTIHHRRFTNTGQKFRFKRDVKGPHKDLIGHTFVLNEDSNTLHASTSRRSEKKRACRRSP